MPPYFTPQELNRAAEQFSNYADPAEELFSNYDEALEFGADGIESFAGEGAVNRQFTFTVDNNNTSSALKFYVTAGVNTFERQLLQVATTYGSVSSGVYPATALTQLQILAAPRGTMIDGYFPDIAGTGTSSANGLVASTQTNKTILELQNYLSGTPTRLIKIKVVSDSAGQIAAPFILKKIEPTKVMSEQELYPANSQNQFVNQDKISEIKTNVVLGPNDIVQYSVAASSYATITLYFGASLDHSKKLSKLAGNSAALQMNMPRPSYQRNLPGRR